MNHFPLPLALITALLFVVACDNGTVVSDSSSTYVLKQDAYETADTNGYRTTNALKAGTANKQIHSIFAADKSANDEDFFVLNATAGNSYRIATTSANGDTIDTILNLNTSTTTPQTSNDNGDGTLAVIDWWESPTTGPYIVVATGRGVGYYGIVLDEFAGGKVTAPYARDFESSVTAPWSSWTVDPDIHHAGLKSLRTAAVGNSASTTIQLLVEVPAPGKTLSFFWKVSSEAKKDLFKFSVDGTEVGSISGSVDWTQVTKTLATGVHILRWEYTKNSTAKAGYDSGWLDDLTIQ